VRFAARWTLLWAWCLLAPAAQAHLIEAHKGTLNLLDRAAYLVVSLPVSALDNVDDDGDGALSPAELEAHAGAIRAQVIAGVQLLGPDGALPLHLLMLDETPPEDSPGRASRHVVAMGWFDLGGASAAQAPDGPALREGLRMRFRLFGKDSAQRELPAGPCRQGWWSRRSPPPSSAWWPLTCGRVARPGPGPPPSAWPWCSCAPWFTAWALPAP